MVQVDFYEKPGCVGNAKQKRLLEAAGYRLHVRNLLAEPWTPARLRPFFGDRPVAEWFNPTAPPITRGELAPDQLTADRALESHGRTAHSHPTAVTPGRRSLRRWRRSR